MRFTMTTSFLKTSTTGGPCRNRWTARLSGVFTLVGLQPPSAWRGRRGLQQDHATHLSPTSRSSCETPESLDPPVSAAQPLPSLDRGVLFRGRKDKEPGGGHGASILRGRPCSAPCPFPRTLHTVETQRWSRQ